VRLETKLMQENVTWKTLGINSEVQGTNLKSLTNIQDILLGSQLSS